MTSLERRQARYERRQAKRMENRQKRSDAVGTLEEIYSFRNMFKYGRMCCRNVRWKRSTQNFELHLFSGTARRRKQVLTGKWRQMKCSHFIIKERGKIRPIDAPHIADRQIHKVLTNEVLYPLYGPSMMYTNGASQKGKGLHWQYRQVKKQLARHFRKYGREGAVLLMDLKGFFPNARRELIYERHRKYILDERVRAVADYIVTASPSTAPGRGLPLGLEPSQAEMVSMPSDVDNWIKCQMGVRAVNRYMDDYLLLFPSVKEARMAGHRIVKALESKGIRVNKNKCRVVPLRNPFRWCKMKFTLLESGRIQMNACRDGVKRARIKLRLFLREVQAGERELEDVRQYMECQTSYYRKSNDHGRLLRLRRFCHALFQTVPGWNQKAPAKGAA